MVAFKGVSHSASPGTNFHGWRRVWGEPGRTGGENRGGEPGENRGGEPGENRGGNRGGTGGEPGAPERTGGEPGAFGKRTGGEPGAFGIHLQRVPGEKRGFWDKSRGRTGGREFSLKHETQLGT